MPDAGPTYVAKRQRGKACVHWAALQRAGQTVNGPRCLPNVHYAAVKEESRMTG